MDSLGRTFAFVEWFIYRVTFPNLEASIVSPPPTLNRYLLRYNIHQIRLDQGRGKGQTALVSSMYW